MTAIVGITDGTTVYLAGDSAGSDDWHITVRADPKVFRNGEYVIGFTTSFRMGQIIRYAELPKALDRSGDDLHRFMCTDFIDAVRLALKTGGWAKKDNEVEEGGNFLVGVNGHLFEIYKDYQVEEVIDGYAACGGGFLVALGALHATADRDLIPEDRLAYALSAASHHHGSVRGPWVYESTEEK